MVTSEITRSATPNEEVYKISEQVLHVLILCGITIDTLKYYRIVNIIQY